MPDFVALTDAETDYKKPIRQALKKKIKDNFDNHESRITMLEGSLRLFDHFNWDEGQSRSFAGAVTEGNYAYGPHWIYRGDTGSPNAYNVAKPDYSVGRMQTNVSDKGGSLWSRLQFDFSDITKPLTVIWRVKYKHGNNGNRMLPVIGLRQGPYNETIAGADRNGIWLRRYNQTDMVFTSYDGTPFTGTSFAKPSVDTWFAVKIVFTDDPSNRALCYVDTGGGFVLKETITSNLPTSAPVRAFAGFSNITGTEDGSGDSSGHRLDADRCEFSAEGLADAA